MQKAKTVRGKGGKDGNADLLARFGKRLCPHFWASESKKMSMNVYDGGRDNKAELGHRNWCCEQMVEFYWMTCTKNML